MKREKVSFAFKSLRFVPVFCLTCAASFAWAANTSCTERTSVKEGIRQLEPEKFETSGSISPKDALEYMKTKKDLVIVDVAAKRWYAQEHFKGAINIPIEELSTEEEKELYLQLPKDRSVVMHCWLGMIVSGAYRMLKQLRPDISEIYYIDGKPLFEDYNEWINSQENDKQL